MNDNDLITRREVELVLLEKGQKSKRYKWGAIWELNFDEIREALSEYQPEIVRCRDCKDYQKWNGTMICMEKGSVKMIDRNNVIKELGDLCEYMFHEYKVCYHGDENDTYNRFLTVNNALNLLKEQPEVVRCKDCRFRDDPNSVISELLPCQFARTPDDWFCACGRTVRENRTTERR